MVGCTGYTAWFINIMVAVVLVVLYWWLWWLCCSVFVPIIPPQPDTLPATGTFTSMIGHYTRLAKRSQILSLGTVSEAHSANFTLLFMNWLFMVSWYLDIFDKSSCQCQGGYCEDGSSLTMQATWVECCFLGEYIKCNVTSRARAPAWLRHSN